MTEAAPIAGEGPAAPSAAAAGGVPGRGAAPGPTPSELVPAAIARARRWAAASATDVSAADRRASRRLARLVADPAGLDLAVRFVDLVVRPEDRGVAARELARLARTRAASSARFLGSADRALLKLGGRLAVRAPGLVVPLARRRVRSLVGGLVVDARDRALARHIAQVRRPGVRLNLNLLGEAVLGAGEAARRSRRTRDLLARPDVDYVSVKVSGLVPQLNPWDLCGNVDRVLDALRPVLRAAARCSPPAFVTLDMEEYRDLDLTIEAFTAMLSEPEFAALEAGIAIQAYLPDALAAFERLLAFARERRARGGAKIKIRLVKGANLAMERVEAELHGWAPAPYSTKAEVDAAYVRLLDVTLRPDVTDAVRIGVGSHNLFHVALALELARSRGVESALDVEMLHGMAPAQAAAVQADVGSLVLYTPVAHPGEFDVAVAYLVRRLEENAGGENFLHAIARGRGAATVALAEQERRFVSSVAEFAQVSAEPRRRRQGGPGPATGVPDGSSRESAAFTNAVDADPADPAARSRAIEALAAPPLAPTSPILDDVEAVDRVVARAAELSAQWTNVDPALRAGVLRAAAGLLEERREQLWTVLAHEGGKTIVEADPEVSEAVDLAAYYAQRATDRVDGARMVPVRVTVVTPPWNFPVAIPLGAALAALAAGSAVILKPPPQTPSCAEVAAGAVRHALVAHGFPADLLQVVRTDEAAAGRRLVSHPAVGAVLLTGSIETARLFRSWRPELRLVAETSGKNSIVVTPAADLDLAVADIVRSAFGHAGQKCSAASLVILVGTVARSRRFGRQLTDAVSSLRVAWPEDPGAGMGPVIERPAGSLGEALTTLGPGESWLVAPRPLDTSGRLWSAGLKDGVRPGSFFHMTECFGPVLGIMTAATLEDAIRLQNGTAFGLTGGLQSLDEAEILRWLDKVEVGNAYVNRHITGAVVRRQPFGGWKDSSVGPGAKAGGPNYVAQLGEWVPDGEPSLLAEVGPAVAHRLEALRPLLAGGSSRDDVAWLRRAAGSDAHAWATELGLEHDSTGLAAESNVLRYRPAPHFWVRAGAGARWADVVRVVLAATRAGTTARVSVHPSLVRQVAAGPGVGAARRALDPAGVRVEPDVEFAQALVAGRLARGPGATPRVRVIGDPSRLAAAAAQVGATLLTGPVLASGRRELLAALREQTVSRTLHRFGHLPPGSPEPPA